MYRSSQYVIFTSCNVVVLRRIIFYCNVGWGVKDGAVRRSRQQWLIAKWLGLGVTVRVRGPGNGILLLFCFLCVKSDKDLCVALLAR